jgi:putative membrane protein
MLLPTINAMLNSLAAVLLIAGYRAIKSGRIRRHQSYMLAALAASAAFLACYLLNRYIVGGLTRYEGEGLLRFIYFAILLTHTPLATLMVPFILAAVYLAYKGRFAAHARITRWIWPVWMYVSVTGVLIYIILYLLPPGVQH